MFPKNVYNNNIGFQNPMSGVSNGIGCFNRSQFDCESDNLCMLTPTNICINKT